MSAFDSAYMNLFLASEGYDTVIKDMYNTIIARRVLHDTADIASLLRFCTLLNTIYIVCLQGNLNFTVDVMIVMRT